MPIKVSVIVPVYNAENFISECLNSVVKQNFGSLEILVSDDCSSDGTRKVLEKYENNSKLRIFYQENNLGITKNCNFLLRQAKGKYICFFAGDDIMLPDKIQKQFCFMERMPYCSFCYHEAEILQTYPGLKTKIKKLKSGSPMRGPEDVIERLGIPASMSMMVRRSDLPVNLFNESFDFVSDWLMQIELSARGSIGYIDETLCQYRKYGDTNSKDLSAYEHEFISVLNFVSIQFPEFSSACSKGKSRYLLGKFFREKNLVEKRKIMKNSLHECFSFLGLLLLLASYLPFAKRLFSLIYEKRFILKNLF